MPDFTGIDERAYVFSAIGTLAGGRVFKGQVPDEAALPTSTGKVLPYIVIRFQTPFATADSRSIAGGEQKQPHWFTATTIAFSGDPTWTEVTNAAVQRILLGARPSARAGELKLFAGYSFTEVDSQSRPTRYAESAMWRCPINL